MDELAAVQQLKCTVARNGSAEARQKGSSFKPRADDVFVATPFKCGTTWMSQVVQSLRSSGDMDFEDIDLVMPYLEFAHDYGITNLDVEQRWQPRLFKTHFWRPHCPHGSKAVVVVRDPEDVAPSMFHYYSNWMFDAGTISLDAFTQQFWTQQGPAATAAEEASYFHFLASWWPHRNDPNVLFVTYEDMVAHHTAAVELVAKFMFGPDLCNDELVQTTVQQSSLAAMKQNASKYDTHTLKLACNEAAGRPKQAGLGAGSTAKVRSGKVGVNKQELSQESRAAIQAAWDAVVAPVSGCASYSELRQALKKESAAA
ncbi:hypothetical protein OEZ86_001303 [Tetradesmus obliquus]|nr:hypothetical protein OEZ86_001303 [Tetradesmus obliquus]